MPGDASEDRVNERFRQMAETLNPQGTNNARFDSIRNSLAKIGGFLLTHSNSSASSTSFANALRFFFDLATYAASSKGAA